MRIRIPDSLIPGQMDDAVFHLRYGRFHHFGKAVSEISGILGIALPDCEDISLLRLTMYDRNNQRCRQQDEKYQNQHFHFAAPSLTANRIVLSHLTPLPVTMSTTASKNPREIFHM